MIDQDRRVNLVGVEHDIRSFKTQAEARRLAKSTTEARGMTPLRGSGRFWYYWFLGEITKWTESTLAIRHLTPSGGVQTGEFERPSLFDIPGLASGEWAAAQVGNRWVLRRPPGDLIDGTILSVDEDYAIVARQGAGRLLSVHLPSTMIVRRGGHQTRTVLISGETRLYQKPSGRVIGNRLVSALSRAVCDTCGWSAVGNDREGARDRARRHRELAELDESCDRSAVSS